MDYEKDTNLTKMVKVKLLLSRGKAGLVAGKRLINVRERKT